jgi:hypothetical protein
LVREPELIGFAYVGLRSGRGTYARRRPPFLGSRLSGTKCWNLHRLAGDVSPFTGKADLLHGKIF